MTQTANIDWTYTYHKRRPRLWFLRSHRAWRYYKWRRERRYLWKKKAQRWDWWGATHLLKWKWFPYVLFMISQILVRLAPLVIQSAELGYFGSRELAFNLLYAGLGFLLFAALVHIKLDAEAGDPWRTFRLVRGLTESVFKKVYESISKKEYNCRYRLTLDDYIRRDNREREPDWIVCPGEGARKRPIRMRYYKIVDCAWLQRDHRELLHTLSGQPSRRKAGWARPLIIQPGELVGPGLIRPRPV